jgi:hypothetical protein
MKQWRIKNKNVHVSECVLCWQVGLKMLGQGGSG